MLFILQTIDFKFEINFGTILSLFVGMGLGVVIVVLLYVLSAIQSIDKKINLSKNPIDVTEKEIEDDIQYAQEKFLAKQKEKGEISFDLIRDECKDLINKIAKRYYPNSKRPIAELTIDEMILLDRYIMDKLDDLLSKKGLRFLKRLKLNNVLKLLNVKQTVDKNEMIKVAKKYNLTKVTSKVGKVMGVLNPAKWLQNIAIKPTINLLTKKICTSLIKTVGQETYHIYSKQAFLNDIEDEEFNKLISSYEINDTNEITKIENK